MTSYCFLVYCRDNIFAGPDYTDAMHRYLAKATLVAIIFLKVFSNYTSISL